MLAIFWDPEHKVLTYVYSGSMVWKRQGGRVARDGSSGRSSIPIEDTRTFRQEVVVPLQDS